ncbi:hypothetical protein ACWCPJ_23580 [Streptomyces collinus]
MAAMHLGGQNGMKGQAELHNQGVNVFAARGLVMVFFLILLSAFLILAGLAVTEAFSTALMGGLTLIIVGFIVAARARTENVRKFEQTYLTGLTLLLAGGVLFRMAYGEQPILETPNPPNPPGIALTLDPKITSMKQQLNVKIVLFLPERWPKQGIRDCEKVIFSGPAATSKRTWYVSVKINEPKDAQIVSEHPDELFTNMGHYTAPKRTKVHGWTRFWPHKSLPDEHADEFSFCVPASKHWFVATRGSDSAISLPGVDVRQNGRRPQLSGKPISVTAVLSQCRNNCKELVDDWAVDSGPVPFSVQEPLIWQWVYSIPTHEPVYARAVKLRVHSIEKAEEEHRSEFLSAVLYGVSAAAFVAGTQELLNRWSEREAEEQEGWLAKLWRHCTERCRTRSGSPGGPQEGGPPE